MKVIKDKLIEASPEHIWKFKGCLGTCEICGLVVEYKIDIEAWVYKLKPNYYTNCRAKAMNEALE